MARDPSSVSALAEDRLPAPRVDAHHHLWRYTPADYGWIGEDMLALRRDFLLENLRSALRTADVDGTIAVQARQTVEETEWLLSLVAEGSPILGVVGWLPLAANDFEQQFRDLLRVPALKGLRHVVQAEPSGFLDSEAFNRGMRALRETDLVYDILIYPHQLEEAARFVDRHQQQAFVLDHMAKPQIRTDQIRSTAIRSWADRLGDLARRPNVSCKVSGLVTEADPRHWTADQLLPYFEIALEAFGANRLMIGTDWPVLTLGCDYAHWWRVVEDWTARLSQPEQEQIMGKTAARVYQLEALPSGTP